MFISVSFQTPVAATLCKVKFGSTEKGGLKNFADDCYGGKQSGRSLEQLREKLGQLKNVGAQKQTTHKTVSTPEHHSGELHFRGYTPNAFESSVHVYKDEEVSNSGVTPKEVLNAASQGRKREKNISSVLTPALGHVESLAEDNYDACGKQVSPSTPLMSSMVEGRLVHTKSDSGGVITADKESAISSLAGNEGKCAADHNSQRKTSVAGETVRNASPREEEAEINHDGSVERRSAFANKIFKRVKGSSYGPALRVRRDDPRAYSKDDHSPGSEKSADNVEMSSPKVPHGSTKTDHHSNTQPSAPASSAAGTVSSNKSNTGSNHNVALPTDEDYLNENRKRKADADPSVIDSSLVLTGVATDQHSSVVNALEDYESVMKGGKTVERERGRGRGLTVRETGAEFDASEQLGEKWSQDAAGHPPVVSCAKATTGHDREPWAWKSSRDLRSVALTSPNSSEQLKSAKIIGGLPPRCTPSSLGSRDGKIEANGSPLSNGPKYQSAVLKQVNEAVKSELINGLVPPSTNHVKSVASTDDHVVNHLSNSFSSISIGERNASGSIWKTSTHARTPTPSSGHQMNSVPPESTSLTGVSGMTGLTGLTSQSEVSHKTAVTSSHGVESQHRPHSEPHAKEGDRGTEMSDRKELSKATSRSTGTSPEVLASDILEAHSSKACDTLKENKEKNQDNPPHNQHPQRKMRTETENENFVYVNGTRYQKLGKIGKGGSSEVFKVIATNCSIYALKRINLKGRDWSTAQEFYQEIKYLKALRGKRHIIQLIDSEVTNKKVLEKRWEGREITEEAFIYMVLEYGEIDLAGMLASKRKEMQMMNESKLDENWLRFYWQQMLEAVRTIHDERIVHSDLKPANFMLVRGELKLIDFGIAKAIQNDTTNIVRDSQAGTLNYMSPEACLQNQTDEEGLEIKQGRASDIWSLGCILYQMVYGHTPFAELSFYSKIQAITNPHHKINYPAVTSPWLLDIMKKCLTWDRRKRLRIPELLEHPFLQPHLSPFCARCEQLSARMTSSERKQLVDQFLSSYENWGQRYASRNSAPCGQGSPT